MHHDYEQEFGDVRSLLTQSEFSSILPKHWWSFLTGERVRLSKVFQNLGFQNVNGIFITGNIFIGPTILKKWSATKH